MVRILFPGFYRLAAIKAGTDFFFLNSGIKEQQSVGLLTLEHPSRPQNRPPAVELPVKQQAVNETDFQGGALVEP